MSGSPFLTDEEIASITEPLTQGAARCRYLRDEYGLMVKRKPNGQPVVARVEWDAAMLAKKHRAERDPGTRASRHPRPNFSVVPGFKQSA